jgi:protein involved in sex pheromone biosynthesis
MSTDAVEVVVPNFDAEDVPVALAMETQDGPGPDLDSLPPGDFVSFAEADVEQEDIK